MILKLHKIFEKRKNAKNLDESECENAHLGGFPCIWQGNSCGNLVWETPPYEKDCSDLGPSDCAINKSCELKDGKCIKKS